MKDAQNNQSSHMKRGPEEEKRKGAPGGEGAQREGTQRGSDRLERDGQGHLDLAQLIEALHQQFEQDRALASQPGSARCGICYLYYRQTDLAYREEEGFYICKNCQRSLGNGRLKMLRRQQR